jgi:ABC-type branched-subunit amino acid transport system permease subunit
MFGAVIIGVVLFMPRGIVGFVEDHVPALRAKIK